MKKTNLTLWLSVLLMVLTMSFLVSCGDDDAESTEPVETAVTPKNTLEARTMLMAQKWTVPLESFFQLEGIYHFGDVSLDPFITDARIKFDTDAAFLEVFIKDDPAVDEVLRNKWAGCLLCQSEYYNLQPDVDNPTEGFIYDNESNFTLNYRHLTDRTVELVFGNGTDYLVVPVKAEDETTLHGFSDKIIK